MDYLAMEYVAGVSLAEKLKDGPLPAKEALALGAEIGAVLEEAHDQGVVHRDLKPANIMIPEGVYRDRSNFLNSVWVVV